MPVQEWHRVVNERDTGAASILATPDIELGGPKGVQTGVSAFVEWIGRAGIYLEPTSYHPVSSDVVVVEQIASWPDNREADPKDAPVKVATLFRLEGDRVAKAIRFGDLHAALEAASS
jgi:hypothetical protein